MIPEISAIVNGVLIGTSTGYFMEHNLVNKLASLSGQTKGINANEIETTMVLVSEVALLLGLVTTLAGGILKLPPEQSYMVLSMISSTAISLGSAAISRNFLR